MAASEHNRILQRTAENQGAEPRGHVEGRQFRHVTTGQCIENITGARYRRTTFILELFHSLQGCGQRYPSSTLCSTGVSEINDNKSGIEYNGVLYYRRLAKFALYRKCRTLCIFSSQGPDMCP